MAVAVCLFITLTCAGGNDIRKLKRQSLGVNLGQSMKTGGIEIVMGQELSKHWSIEASRVFELSMVLPRPSQETAEHYKNIGHVNERITDSGQDLLTGNIRIAYWPDEVFSGITIMAGCRYGMRNGLRGSIKAGYVICLWRRLRCTLGYDRSIGKDPEQDISLTLSYTY